ncbi:MAG: hypothetical protein J7K51_09135 [Thermotogae bacterium]|nr:hypothetical protein [Thermotogota bacterium]
MSSFLDHLYAACEVHKGLSRFLSRKRDLTLLKINECHSVVIACDSNASIGMKPNDYVKRDFFEVGRSAVKVPLMEVIAVGALPVVVIDTLCVELEPTGKEILKGIYYEVRRLGLPPDLVVNGSSEKNMLTTQTGLGVTVFGIAKDKNIKIGTSKPGEVIVCVGLPKSAPEKPYREGDPEIMDPPTVANLRNQAFINEILPVGSHGILYEMNLLAEEAFCVLEVVDSPIDLYQSAGASTCVLVTLAEGDIDRLKKVVSKPVFKVGRLVKPKLSN